MNQETSVREDAANQFQNNDTIKAAWFQTRMEADKSLLTISSGAIGLLLAIANGSKPIAFTCVFTTAFIAFTLCIILSVIIFKLNAEYLQFGRLENTLKVIDWFNLAAFGLGIVMSAILGISLI